MKVLGIVLLVMSFALVTLCAAHGWWFLALWNSLNAAMASAALGMGYDR